jgi:hypothetical protein
MQGISKIFDAEIDSCSAKDPIPRVLLRVATIYQQGIFLD